MKHDGSTHWMYIGEVVATGQNAAATAPLLYFDRQYRQMHLEAALT
jgi:flavin reductase (DIM6/NTAB) family NADH-FMN oxidoreductase RutF